MIFTCVYIYIWTQPTICFLDIFGINLPRFPHRIASIQGSLEIVLVHPATHWEGPGKWMEGWQWRCILYLDPPRTSEYEVIYFTVCRYIYIYNYIYIYMSIWMWFWDFYHLLAMFHGHLKGQSTIMYKHFEYILRPSQNNGIPVCFMVSQTALLVQCFQRVAESFGNPSRKGTLPNYGRTPHASDSYLYNEWNLRTSTRPFAPYMLYIYLNMWPIVIGNVGKH